MTTLSPFASSRVPSLGFVLPTFPVHDGDSWRDLPSVARGAEAAGAAALWACDHLFWPSPTVECLVALASVATATSSCALGTAVLQLPLRKTSTVAKQAGSLQAISGGRLVLGLGVGQHEGEYDKAGSTYRTRGRDLDAGIAELRRHWSDHDSSYPMLPLPDPVPLWFGGSSDAARHRAAKHGEGWMPLFLGPERLADAYTTLRAEAARCGRDPDVVVPSAMVFASVGRLPEARERGLSWLSALYGLPAQRFTRHLIAGEPAAVTGAIAEYMAAGARHVAVFVADDDPLPHFASLSDAYRGLAP